MVPDNLSVDNLLISVVIMLISWGDNLSVDNRVGGVDNFI